MGNSLDQAGVAHEVKGGKDLLLKKPKAIAFDLDGTIVDSVDYMASTWLQLARSMGIEPEVNIRELVGMTGIQIARALANGDEILVAKIFAERRKHFDVDRYIRSVRLFPESTRVLVELRRRGYRMALASSATTERVRRIASAFGLDSYFDVTVGGDEVAGSKPAPDLIVEVAARCGIETSELVYVGDTSYDVEAAVAAKATAILILRKDANYVGPQPDLTISSLIGLLDRL